MNPMRRRCKLVLGVAVALGACDLEIRPADSAGAQDRRPVTGGAVPGEFRAVPAVRTVCLDNAQPLGAARRLRLPATVERIHARDGDLVMVASEGLFRSSGAGWTRVLEGRDFTFLSDTLVRLAGESLEFLPYDNGAVGIRARAWPARSHDSSFDLAEGRAYLHSTVDPSGTLLVARSLRDGRVMQDLLTIERDFLALFLNDFDRLLEDSSLVRAYDGWVALVPILRNPISLFDTRRRRRMDLFTPARTRGGARTTRRTVLADEQDCPTCTRRIREKLDTRFDRIHADAAFHEGNFWVLATELPGARRPMVYRVRLDSPDRLEAFRLIELDSPPRALAIAGDSLIVASELALYWFELPRGSVRADCER